MVHLSGTIGDSDPVHFSFDFFKFIFYQSSYYELSWIGLELDWMR